MKSFWQNPYHSNTQGSLSNTFPNSMSKSVNQVSQAHHVRDVIPEHYQDMNCLRRKWKIQIVSIHFAVNICQTKMSWPSSEHTIGKAKYFIINYALVLCTKFWYNLTSWGHNFSSTMDCFEPHFSKLIRYFITTVHLWCSEFHNSVIIW